MNQSRRNQVGKFAEELAKESTDNMELQLVVMSIVFKAVEWADCHPAWVGVEERLPPRAEHSHIFSDNVLVCDNVGYMDTARYNFGINRWDWLNNVTHWMPLPTKPVKKGGQDDCKD